MPYAIWKFQLWVADEQDVVMPHGASILTVQDQGGVMVLWAECDTNATKCKRRIIVRGTGHEIATIFDHYIGTVQQHGGRLVWHVFDGGEMP